MLPLTLIRENTDEVIRRLKVKNFDAQQTVHEILSLDEERRTTQNKLDGILAELNIISREIGAMLKANKKEEAEARKNQTVLLKKDIDALSKALENYEVSLKNMLIRIAQFALPIGA